MLELEVFVLELVPVDGLAAGAVVVREVTTLAPVPGECGGAQRRAQACAFCFCEFQVLSQLGVELASLYTYMNCGITRWKVDPL